MNKKRVILINIAAIAAVLGGVMLSGYEELLAAYPGWQGGQSQ